LGIAGRPSSGRPCGDGTRRRPGLRNGAPWAEDDLEQDRPAPRVNERVRPATAADLDDLVRLAAAAIAEQRPTKGGSIFARNEARRDPFDETLRDDLASPDTIVLTGTIDDVVVGYAVAVRTPLHDGACLAVLRELFVEPAAREVGIGELLADEIVQWAKDM